MSDKEYIENIDKVDTDTLFENLEYYGCDGYYKDLWYATIEELKKRVKRTQEDEPNTAWDTDEPQDPEEETEETDDTGSDEIFDQTDGIADPTYINGIVDSSDFGIFPWGNS